MHSVGARLSDDNASVKAFVFRFDDEFPIFPVQRVFLDKDGVLDARDLFQQVRHLDANERLTELIWSLVQSELLYQPLWYT